MQYIEQSQRNNGLIYRTEIIIHYVVESKRQKNLGSNVKNMEK